MKKNENLISLIIKAQGNRKQNEFALHTQVATSMLTSIKKGQRNPSSKTLQKIASRAYNGVTYEQLMSAAGYLSNTNQIKQSESISLKMQQAVDLLKQIDEKNLPTIIGFLQGAIEMQNQIQQKNKGDK